MGDHTPGPWRVFEESLPYELKGRKGHHVSRRIGTVEDHPQLHGPLGVVNLSSGDGPPAFLSIAAPDARLSAPAPDLLACLKEAARDFSIMRMGNRMEKWDAAIAKAEGKVSA